MKISSVVLARTLAYVETFDVNPRGALFFPDFIAQIVKRYHFQKFPKSFEDVDESKGIEFFEGQFGKIVIAKFTIYSSLSTLETRSNTSDSKLVLEDMLRWMSELLQMKDNPAVIRHWAYVSSVSFYSEFDILGLQPLAHLAKKVGSAVTEIWGEPIEYHPFGIAVGHDPLTRKNGIAGFTISHRLETPFGEHKYFSEAPLPTDVHLKLLEEYESAMKTMIGI
jgi:hypothetical protein